MKEKLQMQPLSIINRLTDIVIQNSLKYIKLMVIMKGLPPVVFE